MTVPQDLRYSKEHEWIRLDGDTATIGITHFAQEQLGDVVFVELPEKGAPMRYILTEFASPDHSSHFANRATSQRDASLDSSQRKCKD